MPLAVPFLPSEKSGLGPSNVTDRGNAKRSSMERRIDGAGTTV